MSLYESIKKECNQQGLSISKLEEDCKFPRSSICKWDSNRPSVDKLKLVAEKLHKSMDYFMEGKDQE